LKIEKLVIVAGLSIVAAGASAESTVGTTDMNSVDGNYVETVSGRAATPDVELAHPLIARPADVDVAGRDLVEGATPFVVVTDDVKVWEILGRS